MARRRRREWSREAEEQLSGRRAHTDGVCAKCDEPVLKGERIVPARGGRWMHVRCSAGWEE